MMEWSRDEEKYKIINRERGIQRNAEKVRIRQAKYNRKYKEISDFKGCPSYLRKENLEETGRGEEVKALISLRCGNWEMMNKYWLDENQWLCVFCGEGRDCVEHYVKECSKTKEWFREMYREEEDTIEQIWAKI